MSDALKAFDSTTQVTNTWLHEIMERMGWTERYQAYHALRAVLHALRDQLPVNEAAALGAQLPLLVRGIYYEGWQPSKVPARERKLSVFLAHVGMAYTRDLYVDVEKVTKAVFAVLAKHITVGEVEGVKHLLSHELRDLWPPTNW